MKYWPDGSPIDSPLKSLPRCCFLMIRLGLPIPPEVIQMRKTITRICKKKGFTVIDASEIVTGKDYQDKIWELIASTPISIGISHQEFPIPTIMNIYNELGVARAMGKETLIVKSVTAPYASDHVRDEYIVFDEKFNFNFKKFLDEMLKQADYYKKLAVALEKNPLLAIDFLHRAFLITGDLSLKKKAKKIYKDAGIQGRAKNSVEMLSVEF